MQCPKCGVALTGSQNQMACQTCGGMFVTEALLDEMLRTVDGSIDPTERRTLADWPDGDAGPRLCPHCQAPMLQLVIERIPVERCKTHGVWFDGQELERVLSPHVTAESFTAREEIRRFFADHLEFGSLTALIEAIRRLIRRTRD
ncbi:MAG TPA: zf-TFIIB domain-containing protein [Kofleriaceae bacterium]